MNKILLSGIGSTIFALGLFYQSMASAATFEWTGQSQDGTDLKGSYSVNDQDLDQYAQDVANSPTGQVPATPINAFDVSVLVNGMDTGDGNGTLGLEFVNDPQVQAFRWRWSIHVHTPWDWAWLYVGSFADTTSALRALPNLSFTNGDGMLMPANPPGAPNQTIVGVTNQKVPEPSFIPGLLVLAGLGMSATRRYLH